VRFITLTVLSDAWKNPKQRELKEVWLAVMAVVLAARLC